MFLLSFDTQLELVRAIAAAAAASWLLVTDQYNGGVVALELAAYEDAMKLGGVVFCADMVSSAAIWSGHPKACFCPGVDFHVHAASSTFGGIEIKAYQATTAMAAASSPSIRAAMLYAFDHDVHGRRLLPPIHAVDLARRGELRLCTPAGTK